VLHLIIDTLARNGMHRTDELALFGSPGVGKTVVVHCNGGKGRSATVIVACLIALGQSIPHAIKILQR